MPPVPRHPCLGNWRRGLAASALFVLAWCLLFSAAFLIAFGNPSPVSRSILHAVGNILGYVHPLWGIPAAYILGAFVLRDGEGTGPYGAGGSEKR
jgi:hypothetical protein